MSAVKAVKHIYSVTELTRNIRAVLEDSFQQVWVEGEISNFIKHTSGHMYFSLKDEGSVLSCVMFKGVNQRLAFKPESGLKVIAGGRISVYDKRGQYQIYVENMEPKGVGALQLALEQLKKRLAAEGLFDKAAKKPIPYLPHRIGVVTSPTGAAIRDILNVTKRRFQNIDLIINPVRVQGKGSSLEIAEAIDDFNRFKKVDVIIVARGGGSLEDLWAFNEEIVARAIYASKIPVISGVGHEIDWTIADFVSDFRAPTPSAAAELVIPRKEDLMRRIEELVSRLKQKPAELLQQYQQEVDDLVKDLAVRARHIMDITSRDLENLCGKLDALSPFAVLRRGYSITADARSGNVIKDVKAAKIGSLIKTRLSKGELVSRIESIESRGE